ncbi:hypothetical protein STEG23_038430, partial [Scotinomys teguina]
MDVFVKWKLLCSVCPQASYSTAVSGHAWSKIMALKKTRLLCLHGVSTSTEMAEKQRATVTAQEVYERNQQNPFVISKQHVENCVRRFALSGSIVQSSKEQKKPEGNHNGENGSRNAQKTSLFRSFCCTVEETGTSFVVQPEP